MPYKIDDYSAKELFDKLNQHDECDWIEAKSGGVASHSILETVCAFSNEPSLGGGYIIIGLEEDNSILFRQYKTKNISNPDKFQSDFASQCASVFNIPIRPKVNIDRIHGDTVIKIRVEELNQSQKPIFFKNVGLPHGAYRRVGPTDQKCTEDDMHVFYSDYKSYDQTRIVGSSFEDIDEVAINRYRTLRERINPTAEELSYNDKELLEALGCVNKENKLELNLAGLVLFGTSKALRSNFPMFRVDYIRVPGNQWVEDPDNRFITIDMRGPLLTLIYRLIDAINADLPKGFLLPEGSVQANVIGLPSKALREAIVNALMHRSYREHRPTQVIRYDNRIEIINPGYSLKSEEKLGEPGSETRNPFIAAVFHETNLAETKGSGIRAMRKLMKAANLVAPTFESNRESNEFTSRLLLHHFLDEKDILWLSQYEDFDFTDAQKQALVFIREVGAIDNKTYRQMADCDVSKASTELRQLKKNNLINSKGKGKATYYVGSEMLKTPPKKLKTPPKKLKTPPKKLKTPPNDELLSSIQAQIEDLGKRFNDKDKVKRIIKEICKERALKASEIAKFFNKEEGYFKRKYLSEMITRKELVYLYPEMINHPEQAYKTNIKK